MLVLSFLAFALAAQLRQIQVPKPVGYVNDFAHVISPDAASRMERIIQDVRAKSGGEIVVVTLPDLGGRASADVAREIGRQWKVGASGGPGDRARNAGVIILLVPKETSADGKGYIRVEVGNGAEGFLTDATTGAIQDEALPALRQGDYGNALELITTRVAQRYANEFQFTLDTAMSQFQIDRGERVSRDSGGGGRIPPFVWILLIFFVLSMLRGSRRRRRGCGGGGCIPIFLPFPMGGGGGRGGGWGGGFGGGGFGGGGGGGFGGFGGGGGFSGGGSGRSF